jgi:predicted component of type VI protein secretion system
MRRGSGSGIRLYPANAVCCRQPWLTTELGDLLVRLQARRRLMAMRRESNERMADFAVADVSLFWLLNALNSAEPVLTELLQTPARTRNCCTAN